MNPLYVHTENIHNTRAAETVVPLLFPYIRSKSVLDVGCGTGTWLKVFENFGIKDFLGIDGEHLDRQKLVISNEKFKALDLRDFFDLGRKFDLTVCLEVAEHLPENSADNLVKSLCHHSDIILFSAAIPGQQGQNHLNEQWLSYWKEKFEFHRFYLFDLIRSQIWENRNIDLWYRQNMVFIAKEGSYFDENYERAKGFIDIVHPELFQSSVYQSQRTQMMENGQLGLTIALNNLFKTLSSYFR